MAKRKIEIPEVGYPTISKQQGIKLLSEQIEEGKKLISRNRLSSDERTNWDTTTKDYLEKTFGKNTDKIKDFFNFSRIGFIDFNVTDSDIERERIETMKTKISRLENLIKILKKDIELEEENQQSLISNSDNEITENKTLDKTKVFIVHGHNNEIKQSIARFIEKLGFEAIILHEKTSAGKTIIEKLEHYSNVGFGIVIYSADDLGKKKDEQDLKSRARQNVVFEHGYLIGKLGRENVCAIVEDSNIEIFADINGIVYITFDKNEGWKLKIGKELKNIGYSIDYNKIED